MLPSADPETRSRLFSRVEEEGRIFLHVCCGPCAEWPLTILFDAGISVTSFFYNPNIHPETEQARRLENVEKLMQMKGIPLFVQKSYLESDWVSGSWEGVYASRCEMCYSVRMEWAARAAKENGYSFFSTSLLVSPYQDFDGIVRAGSMAAEREGISFLPFDFRPGFRRGQQMARDDGLYLQKYCGCIFSLRNDKS